MRAAAFTWAALARLGAQSAAPEEEVVAVRPLIVLIRNFATAAECEGVESLLARCHAGDWPECHEIRSRLHASSNKTTRRRPWRNSTSFTLDLGGEIEPAVDRLVRRAHLLARHPITYGEGVQVASYQEGDYYEFHHDSLMRRATALLYLNEVPQGDGGETVFPLVRAPGVPEDAAAPLPPAVWGRERKRLDFKVERMEDMLPYCESDFYLKIRPEAGMAVLFYSYRPDYSMDEYAIHGSCPLRRGRKAIFQRWMRFEENELYAKSQEAVRSIRTWWGRERLLYPGEAPNTTTSEPREARPADQAVAPLRSAENVVPPEL